MIQWLAGIVTELMDTMSDIFLEALGTEMTTMEEYFPFASSAYEILQYSAWALLLLITVWQLFRIFGGPITEAENPWHLIIRSSIFAVCIQFAKPIFIMTLEIARGPYTALMDHSIDPGSFTFAGIEQIATNSITTLLSLSSGTGTILILILMICLGWNYFKLLLGVVERYVLAGVLCYTSPLAFSLGGSKSTNNVFKSWCRMVGSQLMLLVLNVWFIRMFNSSVGQFVANGGALTNGNGSIFLWMFCALALLKVGQKFESYLSAIGLSVSQTGSNMAMEMLMASRVLAGAKGGKSAGSVFSGGASAVSGAKGSFASGFTSMFNGNNFVRDAVVEGGQKMTSNSGTSIVGRAFGGFAAKHGASLNGNSIASVAGKPAAVSGKIGGEIADRSVGNFMPHLSGQQLSGTEISGGHISTQMTGTGGKDASVDLYSASQFEKPAGPHSTVTASDGSTWYQTASGAGMSSMFPTPSFSGDVSESGQALQTFPDIGDGTLLRTVDNGTLEASYPDGSSSLWYNSGHFAEPDAPHSIMTDANDTAWYAMEPHADMSGLTVTDNDTYFQQFMPGYEQPISAVSRNNPDNGQFEIQHSDGSGTAFYDTTMYQSPRGNYNVYEDTNGGQWYALPGSAGVDRVPLYKDGKPVYENGELATRNVETIKYRTTPTRFETPHHRDVQERIVPRKKQ